MNKKNKKGQEEMIGFVLIVVLVTVILVILLMIMLNKSINTGEVYSYQVESFVSAILSYSSECSTTKQNHLPVQRLIGECLKKSRCLDGKDSCAVLNETISNLIEASWKTENRPVLGYKFEIGEEGAEPMEFSHGNITTKNSIFSSQTLQLEARTIEVKLEVFG